MKIRKYILIAVAILLCAAVCLAFTSCGSDPGTQDGSETRGAAETDIPTPGGKAPDADEPVTADVSETSGDPAAATDPVKGGSDTTEFEITLPYDSAVELPIDNWDDFNQYDETDAHASTDGAANDDSSAAGENSSGGRTTSSTTALTPAAAPDETTSSANGGGSETDPVEGGQNPGETTGADGNTVDAPVTDENSGGGEDVTSDNSSSAETTAPVGEESTTENPWQGLIDEIGEGGAIELPIDMD